MSVSRTTPLTLAVGDTLVLKEPMADGWWRVEINGTLSRVQIGRVKTIKRQKSSEEKEKGIQRQTSHKKEGSSSSGGSSHPNNIDPAPIASGDSIVSNKSNAHTQSTPAMTSPRLVPVGQMSPRPAELRLHGEVSPTSTAPAESSNGTNTPEPGAEGDDESKGKHSMRKRASKLFQEGVEKVGSLWGAGRSKSDGDEVASSSSGVNAARAAATNVAAATGEEATGEKEKKGLLKSRSAAKSNLARSPSASSSAGSTSRQAKAQVKGELRDIAIDVEETRVELGLVLRVVNNEAGVAYSDPRLPQEISPEQRILEKMLEGSFSALFANANGQKAEQNIALAPPRPVFYSEILIPPTNLNALSGEEKLSLQTLDFNVFPYKDVDDEEHVFLLLMVMFHDFDLPRIFKISDATLYRFLLMVSRKYRSVPFHNFFHAFNVTQTLYYFLRTCQASKVLGPLEILAMLIAAICHDCDHPGLNNDFQRKAQTRIYHMHKKSVLENHHYLQCMSMLAKPETNILANLTQEQEDQIYIYLRDLILATDLAVHGIILKSLTERKKILAKHFKTGTPVGITDEDRKLIMVSLVKCADLSNEIRKTHLSKLWAKLVIEEFFAQSDKEREMGLPVTPFMDKHKIIIAKEQINFIEKLCLPLYTQLAQVFPEIDRCCQQLEENRSAWQDRLRLFFTDPDDLKKLSNKSIWEREQVKIKGTSLSSTLAMRASNSQLPKSRRPSFSGSPLVPGNLAALASSSTSALPVGSSPMAGTQPSPLYHAPHSSSVLISAARSSPKPATSAPPTQPPPTQPPAIPSNSSSPPGGSTASVGTPKPNKAPPKKP